METVFVDTHVVVWLFGKNLAKFSPKAIRLLEESELLVSAMVALELQLLFEIGRINYKSGEILSDLR